MMMILSGNHTQSQLRMPKCDLLHVILQSNKNICDCFVFSNIKNRQFVVFIKPLKAKSVRLFDPLTRGSAPRCRYIFLMHTTTE